MKNYKRIITETIKSIKKGGVVVFPTDTVYGLIADARNEKAVKKIFQIKKRTYKKPLPLFIKDIKMIKKLAKIDKVQEKFLKKVWPAPHQNKFGTGRGKVTVILRAKPRRFPKGILSKNKKIGLRIPKYKLLNTLLKKLNFPLAETSANISGKKESTKIKEVLKQFENKKWQPDLIFDAGNLKPSLPSTVIDASKISASTLTGNRRVDLTIFKILREGAISKRKILKILNQIKK